MPSNCCKIKRVKLLVVWKKTYLLFVSPWNNVRWHVAPSSSWCIYSHLLEFFPLKLFASMVVVKVFHQRLFVHKKSLGQNLFPWSFGLPRYSCVLCKFTVNENLSKRVKGDLGRAVKSFYWKFQFASVFQLQFNGCNTCNTDGKKNRLLVKLN